MKIQKILERKSSLQAKVNLDLWVINHGTSTLLKGEENVFIDSVISHLLLNKIGK